MRVSATVRSHGTAAPRDIVYLVPISPYPSARLCWQDGTGSTEPAVGRIAAVALSGLDQARALAHPGTRSDLFLYRTQAILHSVTYTRIATELDDAENNRE